MQTSFKKSFIPKSLRPDVEGQFFEMKEAIEKHESKKMEKLNPQRMFDRRSLYLKILSLSQGYGYFTEESTLVYYQSLLKELFPKLHLSIKAE